LKTGATDSLGMQAIAEAILKVLKAGGRGALATVVRTSGSTPQQAGARLLLSPDDVCVGTVGGGAIEQVVIEALRETRRNNQPQLVVHDLGYDLGMCCGGRMELFLEPIESAPRLYIFGAGHVARPTAALAQTVGFAVSVVDEREEWNSAARFPGCELELTDPATVLRRRALTAQDWLLIVTHDHRLDEETLELALQQEPRYIGLVGSRRKVFRFLQRITARSGPVELGRIYAPVGLELGAVGPEEIAVSIVAELIALRRGNAGVSHLTAVEDVRLLRVLDELDEQDEQAVKHA